ncbi:helix-turn-helix domain-containing protein [Fibrivirga algicola]|uniref:Helix-turn-helix transcriptional regulator n=1 Tax=Fibrivirga algicola TaxID=2950420 RepID=A0ABX0Q9S9_9BACT|nr:helix-turn-helix transcriptional regulator [Fibrivirga algicola]NID08934.1 helix-turn-helix transcriptional regulator [Fibrivirga algicola]
MDITNNIKQARERKGLKQADMAERMGIERSNYSRIENRGNEISVRQLQDIAKALDVELIELVFPEQYSSLIQGNKTIMTLATREQEYLEQNRKLETFVKFIMEFGQGMEKLGLTKEAFSTLLDPKGDIEKMAKERLEKLKDDLSY